MRQFRKFTEKSRSWLKGVTAPPPDPRDLWTEPGERELEILRRARSARVELSAEIDRLAAVAEKSRHDLAPLEERAESARRAGEVHIAGYASELRNQAEAELVTLEDQIDQLRGQQEMVVLTEQRIASRLSVDLSAPAVTGTGAGSESAAVEGDLRSLSRAVEDARTTASKLTEKAESIYRMASAGGSVEKWSEESGIRWLRRRYGWAVDKESNTESVTMLGRGAGLVEDLHREREHLAATIERRGNRSGMRSGYVTALAEETYRLGLRSLNWALELLTATGSPDPRSVENHFQHADECARAIAEARTQMDVLVAGESESDVNAATNSLKRAMDQAAEVQSELDQMGI